MPVGDKQKRRDQPAKLVPPSDQRAALFFVAICLDTAVQRNSLRFFFTRACRKNGQHKKSFGEWNMQGLKLGAMAAALLAMSAPAFAESTVLKNVTVIDGTGAAPKPNSAIVMTDGKIAYVGSMANLKAPAGARIVDLSGKFVMPGIIDS